MVEKELAMNRSAVMISVLALTAAACGGASSSPGIASIEDVVTTATPAAPDTVLTEQEAAEQAFLEFAQCMRDNGVDMADPTVDADGNVIPARPNFEGGEDSFDREAVRDARDICGDSIEGLALGFQERSTTEFADQALAYAQCMRDNGVDMPDPDLSAESSGPGRGLFGGAEIDREDPAFEAANQVCQEEIPGFSGRPGGPGRPGN
jgi:hypothetical protein